MFFSGQALSGISQEQEIGNIWPFSERAQKWDANKTDPQPCYPPREPYPASKSDGVWEVVVNKGAISAEISRGDGAKEEKGRKRETRGETS